MWRKTQNPIVQALTLIAAAVLSPGAAADDLYTSALNSLPDAQGWIRLSAASGCGVPAALDGAGLRVDTLADAGIYCGYFSRPPSPLLPLPAHPAVGILNRHPGFSLRFNLRVAAENHLTPQRGGFSLIVVSADLAAIELAFWDNEIWAYEFISQTAQFTHAEGLTLDTTVRRDYELRIRGDEYQLLTDGQTLQGQLRDYSAWPGLMLGNGVIVQPYRVANLLFFGDDTSSAGARIELTTLSLTTLAGGTIIFDDDFE